MNQIYEEFYSCKINPRYGIITTKKGFLKIDDGSMGGSH